MARRFSKGDIVTINIPKSWTNSAYTDYRGVEGEVISYGRGYCPLTNNWIEAGYLIKAKGLPKVKLSTRYLSEGTPKSSSEILTERKHTLAQTKESLIKQVESVTAEITEVIARLDYIKQNGITEFNETEYKAYRVLDTIEKGNLTQREKAKLIAEIVGTK